MKLDKFMWTREPNDFKIKDNTVEITTKPYNGSLVKTTLEEIIVNTF